MTISVPDDAEIRDQINESGRVLAALIGKKFPVAEEVWPGINAFNRMIYDDGLMDTWVTMIGVDDREVSGNVRWYCAFLAAYTNALF